MIYSPLLAARIGGGATRALLSIDELSRLHSEFSSLTWAGKHKYSVLLRYD